MFNHWYRFAARRGDRKERPPSNTPHAPTSKDQGTAPAQPSTWLEQTPSTGITNPSNTPADFGSSPFPVQHQAVSVEDALAPRPQATFVSPLSVPQQELYRSPGPDQEYNATLSFEAMGYGSHDRGDNMSGSMFVSPGSPEFPARTRHPTSPERDRTRSKSTQHDRKRRSHEEDLSVVLPWKYDPRDNMPGQDYMRGESPAYNPLYFGPVDGAGQVFHHYPRELADNDVYATGAWAGVEPIDLNIGDSGADQFEEDGWVICGADGMSWDTSRQG